MKSDERHELKSNELEKFAARVRPLLEQYGLHMVLGVSAVVVVAAAVMFWSRTSAAERAAGWTELNMANSAEKLLAIAETEGLEKKPVAAWARLDAAEQLLEAGIRESLQNREGDRGLVSDLDEARKNFNLVLEAAPVKSILQERALFGLGRCLETMAGVNQRTDAKNSTPADLLDEASKAYAKLIELFPDSPYNLQRHEEEELGRLERHLRYLKSEKAREFYAWFRTQNPKPKDRRNPFDGFPMGHPPVDSGPVILPEIPEGLRLPDDDAEAGPAFPGASSDSGGDPSEAPAEGEGNVGDSDDVDSDADAPKQQPDKKDGP